MPTDEEPADATESNDVGDISSIAKKPPQILRRLKFVRGKADARFDDARRQWLIGPGAEAGPCADAVFAGGEPGSTTTRVPTWTRL